MAPSTTIQGRNVGKRLKPKPKTEKKSWQTRHAARKTKQDAYASAPAVNPVVNP